MTRVLLSTECVEDWHDECQTAGCGCDCHLPAGVRTRTPSPVPKPAASRERVYAAIVTYHEQNGHAPSVRELAGLVRLSIGTVNYHIHRLDAAGRVALAHGHARTVRPVAPNLR